MLRTGYPLSICWGRLFGELEKTFMCSEMKANVLSKSSFRFSVRCGYSVWSLHWGDRWSLWVLQSDSFTWPPARPKCIEGNTQHWWNSVDEQQYVLSLSVRHFPNLVLRSPLPPSQSDVLPVFKCNSKYLKEGDRGHFYTHYHRKVNVDTSIKCLMIQVWLDNWFLKNILPFRSTIAYVSS